MTKHLCICSQCKSAELIDDRHTTASHCLITWQHMSLTPRRVDLVRDVTSVGDSVITTGARYFSERSSSSHGHHDNRLVLTTMLLYYHLVIYMSVRRVRSVGKTSQLKNCNFSEELLSGLVFISIVYQRDQVCHVIKPFLPRDAYA